MNAPETHPPQPYPLTPEDLRQLHAVQLELLEEFDRLCTRLKIRYQIAAGTLLGAVRHRGFIPWDDDLDVIMIRADYERLLREAPALLGEAFFLQSCRTDPGFQFFFAKLRRHGSRFREVGAPKRMHHGIFIDIFPLDAVAPASRFWRWRFGCLQRLFKLMWVLRRLAEHERRGHLSPSQPAWRRRLGPILQPWLAAVPWWVWPAVLDRIIRSMGALSDKRLACLTCSAMTLEGVHQRSRPIAEWDQTVWLPFEGRVLPATASYEEALSRLYGDYRCLPPEARRVPRHPVLEFALPGNRCRRD
jgi:lipopolysaccharide cholinephosphotransferase